MMMMMMTPPPTMTLSVFYDDHHVVFYIHSSTMLCLKFLWNVRVWILCFSDLYTVICWF
ncbi:hypothetical protein Hanom_Chr08g00696021 [Helianthus anomalus]